MSEHVNRKYPLGTRFYNFQPLHCIPYLLKLRISWCHLANKLKPYYEQASRRYFFVCNSHCQHAARLYHTHRTIGSFSATAGLLVPFLQRLSIDGTVSKILKLRSWGLTGGYPHDSSFLTLTFTAKFQREHGERGRRMREG